MFGEFNNRIKMFPSFLKQLKKTGHEVEFGCVGADDMRKYTIEAARNLHNLKFKNEVNPPIFKENSVDLSGIIDGWKYISW